MANDLTPEQVLAQLRTRGFETGGFRSPLRHFRGKLNSITGSMVQRGQMPAAKLEVSYNFSNVEVIESTEPYPFPIAQISLIHSNRVKSAMGVLGASIDKVINAGLDENAPQEKVKNQDYLVGKVQEWKVTPGHMMWDADQKVETARECWEVISVVGVGSVPTVAGQSVAPTAGTTTPVQRAIELLDGKTLQQWNNMVFQDPIVRAGGGDLVNSIINGEFIPPLEAAGIISKDENGIYHKGGK
jgi:hypothetical protein